MRYLEAIFHIRISTKQSGKKKIKKMLKYDPEVNMQKLKNYSGSFALPYTKPRLHAPPLLQQTALQKPKPQIKKTNIISNWKNLFKI
jgi:hypothetical protein